MRSFKSVFFVSFYSFIISLALISLIITISRFCSIDSLILGTYVGGFCLIGGLGFSIIDKIVNRDIVLPDLDNVALNMNITCRKSRLNKMISKIKESFEIFKSSFNFVLIFLGIFIIIGFYFFR